MTNPNEKPTPSENTSELEEQIKTQVKDKNTWLRVFYMLLFMLIFYIVFVISCGVGILQFCTRILSGKTMDSLSEFSSTLAEYAKNLVAYITYASNTKPYPFKE